MYSTNDFRTYSELSHSGVLNMKWHVRRYRNYDGTLTPLGREHYGVGPPRRTGSFESESLLQKKSKERKEKLFKEAEKKQVALSDAVYAWVKEAQNLAYYKNELEKQKEAYKNSMSYANYKKRGHGDKGGFELWKKEMPTASYLVEMIKEHEKEASTLKSKANTAMREFNSKFSPEKLSTRDKQTVRDIYTELEKLRAAME